MPLIARRSTLLALCLASLAAGPALAAYPERTLTLVAPYAAGGAADVLSRLLAKKLEEQLGQTVVVENRPGAGTAIGAASVANAKPDGYTLLLSSNSTFSLNPALNPKLPYDAAKSFEPLGLVGTVAMALLVNASQHAATPAQLVAAVKAAPDKFVYGSFGNGTASNFAGEMFNAAAGIKLTHVPYKGSAPLMTDLIGGQIPISFDTVVAAAPQLKNGKIKVLAVTTGKRSALLPDVPTLVESGYVGFDFSSWIALVAPRGLPADVKARLDKALAAAMALPDTAERMKAAGFEPHYAPVADWPAFIAADIARMKAVAERAQIRLD